MKKLEDALRNLPLPDIKVDRFNQNLRRDLQRHFSVRGASSYKWAFLTACFLTGILGSTLVIFIAKPAIPASLHAVWTSGPNTPEKGGVAAVSNPMQVGKGLPVNRAVMEAGSSPNLYPAVEADHRFLSDWYQSKYPSQPFEVKAVEDEVIYAARKFKLEGGKTIIVYTELSEPPAYLENSY